MLLLQQFNLLLLHISFMMENNGNVTSPFGFESWRCPERAPLKKMRGQYQHVYYNWILALRYIFRNSHTFPNLAHLDVLVKQQITLSKNFANF